MAELSNNELLILNNLLGYDLDDSAFKEKTVNQILDEIDRRNSVKRDDCLGVDMSVEESEAFITAARKCIERNPSLGEYEVVAFDKIDANTAAFVNGDDVVAVFWGTASDNEWYDNVKVAGDHFIDDSADGEIGSVYQEKASAFIDSLTKAGYKNITVTGHSKGGNKAQYVTLVNDNVDRCVSFDGQGFSKDFVEAMAEEIERNIGKITNISAEYDIVNALLFPIAGNLIYVDVDDVPEDYIKHFLHYHKPNILLDENGELRNTDGVGPSQITELVNKFSTYISSIEDDEQREKAIEFAAKIAENTMMYLKPEEIAVTMARLVDTLLDIENAESLAIILASVFEFAEEKNLKIDDVLGLLGSLGVETKELDTWYFRLLWEALFDASREISAEEFTNLVLKVKEWAQAHGLERWDEFATYISEDPLRIIGLYASLDVSSETVNVAIKNFLSLENIGKLIGNLCKDHPFVTSAVTSVLSLPGAKELLSMVGGIAVALTEIYLIANHIVVNWDTIVQNAKMALEYVGEQIGKAAVCIGENIAEGYEYAKDRVSQAINFVEDKVTELYNGIKNAVSTGINFALEKVFSVADRIATIGNRATDVIVDGAAKLLDGVKSVSFSLLEHYIKFTQPVIYMIASKVYRLKHERISIDITKVRNCVSRLYALSQRISRLDYQLDGLYYKLSRNNIEQGEGVFTSIANMYNLFRADLNIDGGAEVAKKARQLEQLLVEFERLEVKLKSNVPQKI